MMIVSIAILTFLSINTPVRTQNHQATEISINKTFQELENQIKQTKSLPRPFKGETINIYSYKPSKTNPISELNPFNDKTNIMVVLPYNSNNAKDENLEHLYTKPPMVQLIPNSVSMASLSSIQEEQPPYPSSIFNNSDDLITSIEAKNSLIINQKSQFNSKEINSDKLIKNFVKINNSSRNYDTNHSISSFNPISTNSDHRQSIKKLNFTLNNKEQLIPNSSINILTSDQWKYFAPPPERFNLPNRSLTTLKFHSEPNISSDITKIELKFVKEEGLKFFDDSKNDNKSIRVFETISESPMLFVTPLAALTDDKSEVTSNSLEQMFNISVLNDEKIVENHQIDQSNFIDDKNNHRDDGIFMEKVKKPGIDVGKRPESLKQTKSQINLGNIDKNTSGNDEKNIFDMDFHNLMLIQKLLMPNNSFKSGKSEILVSEREPRRKTQVSTNQWSNFKPMKSSKVEDEGMREFLGKFGLGGGEKKPRNFKESSGGKSESAILDVVPEDMKKILENIGLISMRGGGKNSLREVEHAKPEIKMNKTSSMTKKDAKISHIQFLANPRLKRGPLSIKDAVETYEDDVGNVLRKRETQVNSSSIANTADNTESSKTEESSTIATINIFTSDLSTSSEIPITTLSEIPTSTEATSTFRSNLDDLENSFGGSTSEPDPELPAPRKSGLYFLVDWNTFLEVGEEDKNPVKLKFAPKFGDRSRFIPVSVP